MISRRTVDLVNSLSQSCQFPVSGRKDSGLAELIQGLLAKYRAMILQLQDQLLSKNSNAVASNDSASTVYKTQDDMIRSLQNDIANMSIEKSELIRDRNQVLEVLDLLKSKYQTILNEKMSQNEELIHVRLSLLSSCHIDR